MEKGKRWLLDGKILRASAVSLGAYLLLLSLTAYLTLGGRLSEAHMQTAAHIGAAVAAFAGAALSVRRAVSAAFLTTALFCGVTVLLGALVYGGLDATLVLPFLLAALLGTLAALPLRRRGRKRGRRRAPRHRST